MSDTCESADVSNDENYIFTITCHAAVEEDSDCMIKSIHLWKIGDDAPPKSFWESQPYNVKFSPDSRFIAIPFSNGIGVWGLGLMNKKIKKKK